MSKQALSNIVLLLPVVKTPPKQQRLNTESYDILDLQMPGFEAWIKTTLISIVSHTKTLILLKNSNMISFRLMVVSEHAILEDVYHALIISHGNLTWWCCVL